MPTNLPVPSKNALRALRHLALGTSCTLAIGAGLLTEDRRRRIHAATEVHSNKKKIKSFSNYRTGNSAQAFEDLVSRLQVEDLRRPKSPVNDTESWKSHAETVVELEAAEIEVSEKPPEAPLRVIDVDDEVFGDKLRIIFQQPSRRPKAKSRRFVGVVNDNLGRQPPKSSAQSDVKQLADVTTESQTPAIDDDPTFDKAESQKRQERLSNDVRKLLGEEPANVEAAAARFLDTLAEGLPVGKKGLLPTLIDAATQLLSALRERKLFITNNQVLDAVLLYGPLRKEDFDALRPDRVIRSLLSHSRPEGTVDLPLNPDAIKKAASVFLTPYQEKSPLMSKPMLKLGLKLCREACDSGLYELTKEVFDYMNQCRGDNPICGVEHLILASKNSGDEEGVFRSFQELYTQAIPHELGHWKTINLVVDSLLRLGKFQEAEGVLVVGTDMARIHNLTMSTTAILKLQGKFWRTYKDIERSQAMFDRLEPSIRVSNHPEACYGAIIQFCVEADDEPAAQLYYKSLQKAHPSRPVNIDILGHLARAKAMRQDWAGVEEDFRKIKKMAPRQYSEISASFIQILKIFALSHSIDETESFIRHFVDDLGLSITTYMMNFMVNIYAKLGEIDSISRWVEFSTRRGCQVDSVFFNTMLNQCYDSWKFNFEEIVGLHRRIQEMDQGSRFFDNDTASMMRRIQGLCHLRLTRKSVQPKTSDIFDVLVNPNTVHSNMAAAFNEGDPARTLETYVKARNDGVPPSSKHLQLAIYATLSLNAEDFASCTALIEHANRRGLDTTTHFCYLLFRQSKLLLETGEYRHGHFVEVYKKTTSRILELGKPVPIELITHAMSLMKVYSDTLPLQFWEAMACHLNLTASSLDVAGLTVFLQVYMGCDDAAGVKWTINMLSDNNLLPDMQFFQALKNEKTRLTNVSMDGAYPRAKEEYLHQILEAVRRVGDMREDHRAQKESVTHTITNILAAAIAKKYGVKRLKSEEAPVKYDEDMPLDQNGSASLWDDLVDEDFILPIPRAFGAVGA